MSQPAAIDAGTTYPSGRTARDRYVLARRGTRPTLDPFTTQGVLVEPERAADGTTATTATVFLTGRECPWRCVMCDLWQHTTTSDTPRGAIASQVRAAVEQLRQGTTMPSVIKLYNAGSFFDVRAVPPDDDAAIVEALTPFARVVVESHPALIGDRTWRVRDALFRSGARLEVAMGLETAHPSALERLNKGITVESFAAAARALTSRDVDLRVFLLIHPPFVPRAEQDAWLARSIDVAFDCGATAVSLIPTRGGNGALEALASTTDFVLPSLIEIEHSAMIGRAVADRSTPAAPVSDRRLPIAGSRFPVPRRLLVDTWNLDRFSACRHCAGQRQVRLARHNLEQRLPAPMACDACGEVTPS
jgi:radical SAM enzyme (TIGR01210 family)